MQTISNYANWYTYFFPFFACTLPRLISALRAVSSFCNLNSRFFNISNFLVFICTMVAIAAISLLPSHTHGRSSDSVCFFFLQFRNKKSERGNEWELINSNLWTCFLCLLHSHTRFELESEAIKKLNRAELVQRCLLLLAHAVSFLIYHWVWWLWFNLSCLHSNDLKEALYVYAHRKEATQFEYLF